MTPSTLSRLADPILQSRLTTIAGRYGAQAEDVRAAVTLALIEKANAEPSFSAQQLGYWVKFAAWSARHYAEKATTYDRYVEVEPMVTDEDGDTSSAFDELYAVEGPTVERQVEARERLAALAEAVAGLPKTQRRIAELLAAGYRQHEIADKLGITRGGVGMAVIRMRGRLDVQ